ncbi:MAG TPA: ChbG/HpnK family deacetylase [Polyangia bacterium]|nr:ChbG/HpnK family deacetylase [Polyangia bacterium]
MSDARIRLVVNADDFGMTAEISRGIVRAHREGIVTSTSLLGNCADLDATRALLAQAPELGVGVHLALIGGRPVLDARTLPSLTDGTGAGTFLARSSDFVARWMKNQIDAREVEREFDAQIERARSAGVAPDHLDTHHHLGFLPAIGQAMEAAARRHGIPGIRTLFEKPTLSWVADPARGLEAGLLTGLGWLSRRRMGMLRHGPQSWGFVESGRLDEVRILEIIGRLAPGAHELICHPAESDLVARDAGGRTYHGAEELAALCSDRVRGALTRRGINLCRWKDLW